jgi:hypothetical protein
MDPEKFAKVLALADSDHQGEAQSALRAARIMLARVGLTFRDLAAIARQTGANLTLPPVEPPAAPPVQVATNGSGDEALRRQLRDLETRVQDLEFALTRQRAELVRQRQETKRWHKLAQDTAEKLWDVGQALETHRTAPRHDVFDKRRRLIDMLRDPASASLSNREIARRLGTAARAVAYWRWRLALTERNGRLSKVHPRGRRLLGRLGRLGDRVVRDGVRPG